MNLRMFPAIAPTRRLGEIATALDNGALPSGRKASNYPRFRSTFDRAMMHGAPLVVVEGPTGPNTLPEGASDTCVLLSVQSHETVMVVRIPMLVGASPRLGEWEFF